MNDPIRPAIGGGRLELMVASVVVSVLLTAVWLLIAFSADLPKAVIVVGFVTINLAMSLAENVIIRRRWRRA